MRRIVILLACLAFLVALGGSVGAATPISACTTISSPGVYVLTTDTIYNSATKCIEITSSDVIFDGAGHMIGGVDASNTYGVHVYNPSAALTNVTVKNLRVTDWWGSGIRYENVENGGIENNTVSSNYHGIRLDSSGSNTIAGNILSDNGEGIYLISSSYNAITDNTISSKSSGNGIRLYSSGYNTLTGNTVLGIPFSGIRMYSSSYNTITSNIVNSKGESGTYIGEEGIYLKSSSNYNTITNNTISNNWDGVFLGSSSNNTIYNNLFNNINNLYFSGTNANYWNIARQAGTNIVGGPYLGGNFWAKPDGTGFSGTCMDADWDGICESSYTLAPGNVDYLPLSLNFLVDATLDVHPNIISLKSDGMEHHGRWFTVYMELPEGYDVADINVSTVSLYGTIHVELDISYIGDYDRDNIPDITVNFDYSSVQALLAGKSGEMELVVAGALADGTPFKGSYTVRVVGEDNPVHDSGTGITATYMPMRIWQ